MMGTVKAARNALKAAAEAQQVSRARNGAFRENANQVAFAQAVLRRVQRLHQFPRLVGFRNRDRAHQLGQPVNSPRFVKVPVHQEADEARRAGANQERIGKGDVIAHQQRRPAPGQVFRAAHFNAIERVRQQEEAQSDHEVGQDRQDVPRGAKRNHRHHQQNLVRLHSARARRGTRKCPRPETLR